MQNVKIFVLCAGEGKRLRPYTEYCPKCMVNYLGAPLVKYQLDVFKQFNLNDITLIGGYRNEALPKQYKIVLNKNFSDTNMLFSLFCAEEFFDETSDIIVSYGDIIYHSSVFETLLSEHHTCNVITDVDWYNYWKNRIDDPIKDAETFRWNKNSHRIFELGKKPETLEHIQGQYIGLFKISASFVKNFKQAYKDFKKNHVNYKNAYITDFLQFLIDKNLPIFGVPIHNHWAEFDTITDLKLNLDWL